jgi:hypothetical protein
MKSRTISTEAAVAKTFGECPRVKMGFVAALGHRREWGLARQFNKRGDPGNAGLWYAEAGRHSAALKMARKLLAAPEDTKGAGRESNLLQAARIIIALHKSTGDAALAMCAQGMARKAELEGRLEDAARIFEEAGFQHDAARASQNLRLSVWAENVNDGKK